MIYHQIRFSLKPDAPQGWVERAFEYLHRCGREIPAVQSYCVGRDFGGDFEFGAMYALKDIEGYREYMAASVHRKTDEVGLPVVANLASFDLTDDPDPAIGEKIRELHRRRFEGDDALVELVGSLESYQGSAAPKKPRGRRSA